MCLRGVSPHALEVIGSDLAVRHESVHDWLVQRIAELNHNIVDCFSEASILEKGKAKVMTLFVPVRALAECDDVVGLERLDDCRERF